MQGTLSIIITLVSFYCPNALIVEHKNVDLILSSGFMAFSRQAGFLLGIEDMKIEVGRVIGTSSGSLAGSMFASGMSAKKVNEQFKSISRPIDLCQPSLRVNRGLLSLSPMTRFLRSIIPKDFNQLKIPLGVGVFDKATGLYEIITEGDLADAVTASCAIPAVFQPVTMGGKVYADGGMVDRVGLSSWAAWTNASTLAPSKAIVHMVGTSHTATASKIPAELQMLPESAYFGRNAITTPPNTSLFVVRTPKANAGFFSLRDFDTQSLVAYGLTVKRLLSPEFKEFCDLK